MSVDSSAAQLGFKIFDAFFEVEFGTNLLDFLGDRFRASFSDRVVY